MAKTAAERMSALRARQRASGLVTLTVVVPRSDVTHVRELARRRKDRLEDSRAPASSTVRARATEPFDATLPTARSAISSRDVRRLRELLEITTVGLLVERMTPRLARRIERSLALDAALDPRATAADLQRFHRSLAEFTGDETLHFLLRVALNITEERSTFPSRPLAERRAVVGRIRRSNERIARAVVTHDRAAAERAVRRYFAELEDWLE